MGMFDAQNMVFKFLGDASSYVKAEAEVSNRLTSMAKRGTVVGAAMTAGITLPVMAMGENARKSFADFDHAMAESVAIMDGITPAIRDQMEKTAQTLAIDGVKSSKELAESYFFLASAGLDAQRSMEALPVVAKFATAGAFDMALATDLLTDAQSALGLTSKDAAQNLDNMVGLSDSLVLANKQSNASVQQFSEALTNKGGLAAKRFGSHLSTTMALLDGFASQGTKGSEAGTALANALGYTAEMARKNAEDFKKMGITVVDTGTGEFRNFIDIITDMENAFASMTGPQQEAALAQLGFSKEAINSVGQLIGLSDQMREWEDAQRSATGFTESVYLKQLESVKNQAKITSNAFTVLNERIGEEFQKAAAPYKKAIQEIVQWLAALDDKHIKIIAQVATYASMLGPAILGVSGIIGAVGYLQNTKTIQMLVGYLKIGLSTIRAFTVAAFIASLPFLKVAAIIGLVVGAVYLLARAIFGSSGLSNAWNRASTAVMDFYKLAKGFMHNFSENMAVLFGWLRDNWFTVITGMGKVLYNWITSIPGNWMVAISTVVRLLTLFGSYLITNVPHWFAVAYNRAFIELTLFWGKVVDLFQYFAGAALPTIVNLAISINKVFGEMLSRLAKAFRMIAETIALTLGKIGQQFMSLITGQIDMKTFLAEIGKQMAEGARAAGQAAWEGMGAATNAVMDGLDSATKLAKEKYEAAIGVLTEDAITGSLSTDIWKDANDILQEGLGQMQLNPFDGVDFGEPLEGLNFDLPETQKSIQDNINKAVEDAAPKGPSMEEAELEFAEKIAEIGERHKIKVGTNIEALGRDSGELVDLMMKRGNELMKEAEKAEKAIAAPQQKLDRINKPVAGVDSQLFVNEKMKEGLKDGAENSKKLLDESVDQTTLLKAISEAPIMTIDIEVGS